MSSAPETGIYHITLPISLIFFLSITTDMPKHVYHFDRNWNVEMNKMHFFPLIRSPVDVYMFVCLFFVNTPGEYGSYIVLSFKIYKLSE